MTALAVTGWVLAGVLALLALELRRRLELVADAEHELRGPATALGLAPQARGFRLELDRLGAGLEDLRCARSGGRRRARPERLRIDHLAHGSAAGRSVQVDWRAGPAAVKADRGRLAQALGNLLGNAVEHGSGPVRLRGRRAPGGSVLIEVENEDAAPGRPAPGRGRGLRIAVQAARESGGDLTLERRSGRVNAALELPAADQ
jgi:signal transduction histidine kinase